MFEPEIVFPVIAAKGFRQAASDFRCSRGKLYDLAGNFPGPYIVAMSFVGKKVSAKFYKKYRELNSQKVALPTTKEICEDEPRTEISFESSKAKDEPGLLTIPTEIRLDQILDRDRQDPVVSAVQFGLYFSALKRRISHGEWVPTMVKLGSAYEVRTIQRYMRLAKYILPKVCFKEENLLDLIESKSISCEILNRIRSKVGHKTIRGLYFEAGIMRRPNS